MNATVLAGIGVAWTLGALLVAAVWPRARALGADAGLILPLGLGVGLGATSAMFFFASLAAREPVALAALGEAGGIAGLAWWVWRRRGSAERPTEEKPECHLMDDQSPDGRGRRRWKRAWVWGLASVFVQAGVVAAVVARRTWASEPWGAWDGWAIWNMRARFMFRGGEGWTAVLRHSEIGWSHLDYPLLVPASVARAWAWGGGESAAAAGLVSVLFGAATVALLVAAVARLRGAAMGWIGGLVLLGTPFFVTFAANEHADVPLGFFVLAAVVLVALSGREPQSRGLPALAGVAAGLAAWTKNEGLMFAVIVALGWAAGEWRRGSRRLAWALLAGLGGALVPVIFFKAAFAPGNDLVSGALGDRLAQLFSPERHAQIWAALWRDGRGFGEWRVLPFAAMALALAMPGARRLIGRERAVAWLLGLTLAGYYAVYLITPWDLAGHLASSLPRLLVQLWPGAVLLWCLLATRAPSGADGAAPSDGKKWSRIRAVWVAGNIAVAVVVVAWFARQLAPGEEAAARVAGGAVSIVAGEGWFGQETRGRSAWRWSAGRGEMRLHVEAARSPAWATLRFALRSLSPRTVAVTLDGRELWQGKVGEKQTAVRIPEVTLRPGVATLVFATDAPPIKEATDSGARALGFAVYDLRVE